ncbi:GAF and ANTAR domain-containing protein [Hoyosella sp. YIM 151337]|uniref:GAF and ANTAR domain-containing protein n=1 Tax=Hoyosella sp. YIM 151337 TaxID=2992742 RepID=UPI0022356FBA|nr:GAF and ANTAR domain-containing protein [Hoyosella sp. YIM 151337]MCW4355502.1 GAF and ANTAR domain-containing protein [Hoyosella sp. YIM 151337]
MSDSRDIHLRLADLARDMHGGSSADLDAVLAQTTEAALRLVPGADHVGITLITGRREIQSMAPTDGDASLLDAIQRRHGEGPCLSSAWKQHMIRCDDYSVEERWPIFTATAMRETPVRSSLCFQLFTQNQLLGALNVHSDEPDVFSDDSEEIGLILATHAAIALGTARRDKQFRSALATRDVIGQAKGILMERYKISATEAFNLLVKLSQETNTQVSAVAEEFVASNVAQPSSVAAVELD